MDAMELRFLFKDPGSVSGNCPAVYDAPRDGQAGLVIHGKDLHPADLAQLGNRAPDEGATWIPEALGRRIAAYYNAQG
jgi:hypothetical protein